jgi:hypothetical protein
MIYEVERNHVKSQYNAFASSILSAVFWAFSHDSFFSLTRDIFCVPRTLDRILYKIEYIPYYIDIYLNYQLVIISQ